MWPAAAWIASAAVIVLAAAIAGIRLAAGADPQRRSRVREAAAAMAQYGLLFAFAAVAAAISAHGLVGFARSNIGLGGIWPYLLWGALDGAAGLCAVLLMRRAARGESALAPRLAVWGLVGASALFNWTHAPHHPGARQAFAVMPVIAATLFEFSLRETRHTARGTARTLTGLGWIRPVERLRARLLLQADETITAETALRRARVDQAAWRLHVLRRLLAGQERQPRAPAGYRIRRAEKKAQRALVRVRFTATDVASDVLRQLQVLTLPQVLASLDYSTADQATTALSAMIGASTASEVTGRQGHQARQADQPGTGKDLTLASAARLNGSAAAPQPWGDLIQNLSRLADHGQDHLAMPGPASGRADKALVEVAVRIIAETRAEGGYLSQAELARRLRTEGYSIANGRLRWLSAVSGLQPGGIRQ